MPLQQKRVVLANGIELDVVDEGPRDAPVLIFLHGFPESHRTWRNHACRDKAKPGKGKAQNHLQSSRILPQ